MEKHSRRVMIITGLVIIFLLVFFRLRVQPDNNGVVASIGDEEITWADFIAFAAGIDEPVTDEERMQLLDNLVMQRLVQIYVQRRPALADSLAQRFERERTYAYRQLLQREVERYMVDESVYATRPDLVRFYDQYRVVSLYALFASRLDPEARQRMIAARDSLLRGGDRDEVIASFSDLPDLGFFGYYIQGLEANPERIVQAESLAAPGDVSEVFASDYGPMLLVCGPNPSIDEAAPVMREALERLWRGQSEYEFTEGLRRSFEVNDTLLARVAAGETPQPGEPIITYRQSGHRIDWRRFSDILHDLYFIEQPQRLSLQRLSDLAHTVADQEKRLQLAEELGLAGTLRFRLRWEGYKQALSLEQDAKTFGFVQERMAPVGDAEMRAWYSEHRESFRQPDFFQLQQIVTQTREEAEDAWRRVTAGEEFSLLVKELSLEQGYMRDGVAGLTAILDKSKLEGVYDSLDVRQPGDIIAPTPTDDERWRVIRIHKRIQGAVRPYDELQPYILRKLQMEKWRAWIDGLGEDDSLRVETHYDVLLQMQFPPGRQVSPTNR